MLTVLMTTWFPDNAVGEQRRQVARATMISIGRRLARGLDPVGLHVADDGTVDYEHDWKWWDENWRLGPVSFSLQHRRGVGASFNAGIRAHPDDLLLYVVDDWVLRRNVVLTAWCELLRDDASIGGVRLFPHPGLRGIVEPTPIGWVLRYDMSYGFVTSMRPTIWHPRFWERFGDWPEDCSALECERLMNERVAVQSIVKAETPAIVQALPVDWQPHPSSPELGDIHPGT